MPKPNLSARIVFSTVVNPEEAARLGRILVGEHLAACVTLLPGVQSIFHWKGTVEESVETLLMIKTGSDQLDALEARVHELHSYATPEFLVLDVASGSARYLQWLGSCLGKA